MKNTSEHNRILVLALGNDIMGDDAVGLLAARRLADRVKNGVDIMEALVAGFALMDLFEGYDKMLLLDTIVSGRLAPGSVVEFSATDFVRQYSLSPHFASLGEILELAKRIEIQFPLEIRIVAMEVKDPFILREGVSAEVSQNLDEMVDTAAAILRKWGCLKPA